MDHLPQEILAGILLRLPAAPLLRVCCVSKKLNGFINGSFFVNLHLMNTRNNRVLFLKGSPRRWLSSDDHSSRPVLSICAYDRFESFDDDDDDDWFPPFDLPLPFPAGFVVRLFDSCNGIVCISFCSGLYLCNPTTRKYLALPDSSFASNYAVTHGIGLGFDSATENYYVVRLVWFLGAVELDASSIHRDIEVSSLLCDNLSPEDLETLGEGSSSSSKGVLAQGWPMLGVEIYNLNRNTWRKLDVVLPHIKEKNSAAVLDGRYFHWCTKFMKILGFDLRDQSFRQIDMPGDVVVGDIWAWNVGVVDDSLAFIFMSRKQVDVWVMEEYGTRNESWIKRYSMGYPTARIDRTSVSCWNEGMLFMVMSNDELISCRLRDSELNDGDIVRYGGICKASSYSLSYLVCQATLVSLDRGHELMPWRPMEVRRY